MFRRPTQLCLHFASSVVSHQNATFWGVCTLAGAMTSKFELRWDLCAVHLSPSFIILCLLVRKLIMLTDTQTHKPTNKQIPTKTSNVLRYATTLVNDYFLFVSFTVNSRNYHMLSLCTTLTHLYYYLWSHFKANRCTKELWCLTNKWWWRRRRR